MPEQGPLDNKDKVSLTAKSARMVRPYSGEGGIKKLLKKREAERKSTEQVDNVEQRKDTKMAINGVSIVIESSKQKGKMFPPSIPLQHEVGNKTLGGRISGSRSTAPSRAANPNAPGVSSLRAERLNRRPHEPAARKSKFAAPDDEDEEEMEPHLQGLPTKDDLLNGKSIPFEVPSSFSFSFAKPEVTKVCT